MPKLLVLVGTKAQYIKTAPILRELDAREIPYRLVYTGQHSETFDILEAAFGTRRADDVLVPSFEAATHSSFAYWAFAFWKAVTARIVRREWRRVRYGVVHGDTASTLFTAIALRCVGISVVHVEGGLRSPSLLEPFPEEIVRRVVSRLTTLHFAPDASAANNLRLAKGKVVVTSGNTLRDSLAMAMSRWPAAPLEGGAGGYIVASVHRSENISRRATFEMLMQELLYVASITPVRLVLHPVTRERIKRTGWWDRLSAQPGLELMDRMDYPDFVKLLVGSSALLTDGGSNQEEAAMMGLPTLLLRRATERPDGLGANVVLSELDQKCIRDFIRRHAGQRWPLCMPDTNSPSKVIVDVLQEALSG